MDTSKLKSKLIDCGAVIYVYDYKTIHTIDEFEFETEAIELERLFITNFVSDSLGGTYLIELSTNTNVKEYLDTFIKRFKQLSNIKNLKYLAFFDELENLIYVTFNIDYVDMAELSDDESLESYNIEFSLYSYQEFLDLMRNNYSSYGKRYFYHNGLKKPIVKINSEADLYIQKKNLVTAAKKYKTYEIYDANGKFIICHEYINI